MVTLNPEQQEAVDHTGGPLLLLAGAGSGKTRVITQRIVKLIQGGVDPKHILAVTFTNRAAREMGSRIERELDERYHHSLTVSTFHALGARTLREHGSYFGRSPGFAIYDADDQKALIKRLRKQAGGGTSAAELRDAMRAISSWKSARLSGHAESLPLAVQYEAELRASNAFDFDDLILKTLQLLKENEMLRHGFQKRWTYVCIDEFQDTNDAQYELVRCLCPPSSDLLVVGDDDQSIYGWRGAQVGNILSFNQDYPKAKTIRLERNYRSTKGILDIANRVIANNHKRLGKDLWTERDEEDSVRQLEFGQQREESDFVAQEIQRLRHAQNRPWGDFAILVRANHLSLDFEGALRRSQIPYRIVRGRSFYERAEIRDALAVLRLSVNPDDTNALLRVLSGWVRGVGKKSLETLDVSARVNDRSLWQTLQDFQATNQLRGAAKRNIEQFRLQLQALSEHASESVEAHYQAFKSCLEDLAILDEARLAARDEQERQRAENVVRLLTEIQAWTIDNPNLSLSNYLEETALVADADGIDDTDEAVSVMTVHASKGLEFPVVFVVALEEDVFPHVRSKLDGDVEEERRLFYVAVTRAMDRLFLSRSRVRRTFADLSYQRPSRFLNEIELNEHVEYEPETNYKSNETWFDDGVEDTTYRIGQSVWHGQYGAGTVAALSRSKSSVITVSFPGIGSKKILADFLSPYDEEETVEW